MSENNLTNGAAGAAGAADQAQFTIQKIYVKDVSFEVPGAPQVFNEQGQPELQMNLGQRVQRISDTAFGRTCPPRPRSGAGTFCRTGAAPAPAGRR